MSPFVFAEISRNQGKGKDKLSGKKGGGKERHAKRNICVFCHTAFFLSTGGRIEYGVSQELPAEINQSW